MSGQGIDLSSVKLTVTGTAVNSKCRWRGMVWSSGAIGGDIVLRDGGAGGTVKLNITMPGAAGISDNVSPIGEGIKFLTDLHVTLPAGATVTIFYSDAE